MKSRSLFGVDITLLVATLTLTVIGILFIYSSNLTSTGVIYSNEYIKQIVWVLTGTGILLFFAFFDYSRLNDLSLYIYMAALALLAYALFFGRLVNGARSWLGFAGGLGIQPSEFTKIATILFLARFLERTGPRIRELPVFIAAMIVAFAPVALILLQPDLGTSLVYIPIFLAMTYMAGAKVRHLMFLLLSGSFLILFTVLPAWETHIAGREIPIIKILTDLRLTVYTAASCILIIGLSIIGLLVLKRRYYFWIIYFAIILVLGLLGSVGARMVLKDYQIMRLIVFLDPGVDPRGTGWNVIQSVTAVGSGGFWGKGYLQGTQSHYRYLPEQSTDFIFSIISEEWGFFGCLVVFALFLLILYRGLRIMSYAKDGFAIYLASGITAMIFFHVIINVGMAIGIMPITGIPLFFLSYGGSSLWTAMTGVGILMSVYNRRFSY